MTCRKFREMMYLRDDELGADDVSALNDHTSACHACAAEYARVVSDRRIIRDLRGSVPHLADPLLVMNAVIGRIESEPMNGPSRRGTPAFDRWMLRLSAPMTRAAAAALLVLISGTCALEYTSAFVTMKAFEETFERRSAYSGTTAAAGAVNRDKVVNAAADLIKKISPTESYVEVSDKWVMIDKRSLEELLLLYNELKENAPQLPADFRTKHPELTKILETKKQSAQIHILMKEREQVIRELNGLLQHERNTP